VAGPRPLLLALVLLLAGACAASDGGPSPADDGEDAASTGAGGQPDAGKRDASSTRADAAAGGAPADAAPPDLAAGGTGGTPGHDAGTSADTTAATSADTAAEAQASPMTCGQGTGFDTSVPGVAIDRMTCLPWQRLDPAKPFGTCQLPTGSPAKLCWAEATKYCHDLRLDGREDWRLPTATELHTIVVPAAYPAVDAQVFPQTLISLYWTAETAGEKVVCVDFSNGGMRNDHIGPDGAQGVRCVRGPLPR
jgi:hypothetical protein